MVGISNYNYKFIRDKLVKLEEYFIKLYVDEYLKSDSAIGATCRMRGTRL